MSKNSIKKKNQQTWLFYHYFFLLFGFFGGNLWGSFFSSFYLPPFFFVIGILLCLEILSYVYYKKISLFYSSLLFDAPALYKKNGPRATRAGAMQTLLSALSGTQEARTVPSPYPTDMVTKVTQETSAKRVKQVNQNLEKLKKLSIGNGKNPLPLVFIDFQFNKTKSFSKKKIENTSNFKHNLNFQKNLYKSLYLLKVGLVFGLFVDAFKVGS